MASATTTISLGAYTATAATVARTATVTVSVGVLCTAAPYAASSGINSAALDNLKSWLPPQRVPVVDPKTGLMSVPWYKFFSFVAEVKLGGASAPTVTDLSNNVITVKSEAVAANVTAAAVATQAAANAVALEATKQVVVNSSLAGAAQIPPVTLGNVYIQNDSYSNVSGE
jgi:hypothetical protein